MKLIVISDIHGNCVALDAVLADIQHESRDKIVCLGDAIQGGPQPAEVMHRSKMKPASAPIPGRSMQS